MALRPMPPRLRAAEMQARRREAFRRRLTSIAAGLVLLLAGGAGGWLARGMAPDASAMLAADAVDAHKLFVTEVRHPVEVPASQEAHLVQWLSNRLGRKLRVPDLAPLGFRLMGGRLLPGDGAPAAEATTETLLAETPDGLGAWRHRLPPGAALRGPDPASGDGQFWVVTSGALRAADGATLPALSCAFVAPDEAPFAVTAGEGGLEVVVMQYPRGRDHVVAG